MRWEGVFENWRGQSALALDGPEQGHRVDTDKFRETKVGMGQTLLDGGLGW